MFSLRAALILLTRTDVTEAGRVVIEASPYGGMAAFGEWERLGCSCETDAVLGASERNLSASESR